MLDLKQMNGSRMERNKIGADVMETEETCQRLIEAEETKKGFSTTEVEPLRPLSNMLEVAAPEKGRQYLCLLSFIKYLFPTSLLKLKKEKKNYPMYSII